MPWVKSLLFYIVSGTNLLNLFGVMYSILFPSKRIWPPPSKDSWQFYFTWINTTLGLVGVIPLGILDWGSLGASFQFRLPLSLLLMVSGGGFALWGIWTLSWHQSLGLKGKLVTSGPYKYSRNPQYVGDVILFIGFTVLSNSFMVGICTIIIAAWFLLAPFSEEPWLGKLYGRQYEEYCKKSPRFLIF